MKRKYALWIESGILLWLIFDYTFYSFRSIDIQHILRVLILVFISLIIFVTRDRSELNYGGQRLTITFLFLLGLVITCFQEYFRFVIGDLGYELSSVIVDKSISLSSIGLTSFIIGELWITKNRIINKPKRTYSTGLIQSLAVLFFVLFLAFTDASYFRGGYSRIMNSGGIGIIPTYAQNFYQYCVIGAISLVTWNFKIVNQGEKLNFIKYIRLYKPLFVISIIIYCILIILSGDRGPLLRTALVFFIGYIIAANKIVNGKKLLLLLVGGVSIMFFLGALRLTDVSQGWGNRFNEASGIIEGNESLLFSSTNELAVVIRAQHAIMMYVDQYGFVGFHALFYPIIGIVPGLGLLYETIFGIKQEKIISAYVATNYMGADHGMGTTCLADLYLSYGIVPVILFMFFLGMFLRNIEYRVFSGNSTLPGWVCFFALMGAAIGIGRASAIAPFRDILYILLFIFLTQTKTTSFKRTIEKTA